MSMRTTQSTDWKVVPPSRSEQNAVMDVSVYHGETSIGTGRLEHLDPPTGVAFGPFLPTGRHDRDRHANVIVGQYTEDRDKLLTIYAKDRVIGHTTNAIADWTAPVVERKLAIWFQEGRNFAVRSAHHADHQACYAG